MRPLKNKWIALFLSNFLGVFNDNLLKNSIIFIAISWSLPSWLTQSQLVSVVSAGLVVPYLFLSPLAGHLSVKYSKLKIFRLFKLVEIPLMLIACISFHFHQAAIAILVVFLMGIVSCLYSPAKYSLIRDIGGEKEVSKGSGTFETMAFLGILIGTVTASIISDYYHPILLYTFFIGLAIAGYYITRSIHAQELPEQIGHIKTLNPLKFLWNSYQFAKSQSDVNSAVFGASVFWLIGGMLQMNLVIHCKQVYHTSNMTTGIVMASAAIGIATGCISAGKISGNQIKKGLILVGITGMTLIFATLSFFTPHIIIFSFLIIALAFLGGFFQVPCLSMLQHADIGRKLGDMIAYLNLVTFVFILLGTFVFSASTYLFNENSFIVFGIICFICLTTTVYFLTKSPVYLKETKQLFCK